MNNFIRISFINNPLSLAPMHTVTPDFSMISPQYLGRARGDHSVTLVSCSSQSESPQRRTYVSPKTSPQYLGRAQGSLDINQLCGPHNDELNRGLCSNSVRLHPACVSCSLHLVMCLTTGTFSLVTSQQNVGYPTVYPSNSGSTSAQPLSSSGYERLSFGQCRHDVSGPPQKAAKPSSRFFQCQGFSEWYPGITYTL
jgi:hypothetical protein